MSLRSLMAHPLAWLLAIALAHVVVRVAVSPALKWDEAEQMLWSRELALGYGAQPPLYTWLQWLTNQVFGPSVLALSLLKHTLLALTYTLMWLAGRELLGQRGAWWASASMLLFPALGWDSVRDQTHSILVTAMACGAWWLLLRIVKRSRSVDFALLGLVCGVGLLAKYSFALVIGVMLVAALSVPQARRALFARGWWWVLIVGGLVVLPHAIWLASHLQEATAGTLAKMEIQPALGRGLLDLLIAIVGMLALWALVALAVFRSACWRRPLMPVAPWAQQIFVRYVLLALLVLLGMVLAAGVTHFEGRWVLPLLCMVPLAVFAARPELQHHPRAGRYSAAVVFIALIFLLAAGLRPWVTGLRGHPDELNHPVVELGNALRQAGYDSVSPIIAADHMLAGALLTRFPRAPVNACTSSKNVATCIASHLARARTAGQGWLLISREDRLEPGWWAGASAGRPALAMQSIRLPFHKVRPGVPPAHYQFVWQPAGTAGASTREP
ncbi:ArnT family glycosyltransferase [Acidovorax soli]|uniref:ArnT family glycosyltransferase n=1 Tax=Acidovorax soli TaxID=592050 RepID=UPI0032B2CBD9